jgi:large subunit ribosomal protein L28
MSKRCDLTGKDVMSGNNVSHSKRKTRRRFMPNIQQVSLLSDALGQSISMRVTASTLRTIDHNGGLDSYLMGTHSAKLSDEARMLKKRIVRAQAKAAATAAA